jgi:hypothetical protein
LRSTDILIGWIKVNGNRNQGEGFDVVSGISAEDLHVRKTRLGQWKFLMKAFRSGRLITVNLIVVSHHPDLIALLDLIDRNCQGKAVRPLNGVPHLNVTDVE